MKDVKTRFSNVRVGRMWFTSDLLLGSEHDADKRGFTSAAQMNESIVNRWNELVKPGDVVWILGNLASAVEPRDHRHALETAHKLNGTKHLMAGPKDRCLVGRYPYASKMVDPYKELAGLASVITGREYIADNPPARRQVPIQIPLMGGTSHGYPNVVLSPFHYPDPDINPLLDDYAQYRPRWVKRRAGQSPYLVHGEASWVIKDYPGTPAGKSLNVSMDAWGFEPVPAEMVADMLRDD